MRYCGVNVSSTYVQTLIDLVVQQLFTMNQCVYLVQFHGILVHSEWVIFVQVITSDWNLSVLIAVVCVHGTAWTTSSSTREILSFRPKHATRHQSSTPLALLLAVELAAIRTRRRLQAIAVAIHGTRQWTTQRQRRQAKQSVYRWSMCVNHNRRVQVHQQCATVNHHCQPVHCPAAAV